MNFIWISPEMPYPANTGGRVGIMKRLEYLGKKNNIFFFCIIDSLEDQLYKNHLLKYCKSVYLYNRTAQRIYNILRSLILGPYACISRTSKLMKNDIHSLLGRERIDYIIVDFPQMLGNIDDYIFKNYRVILNQHNIEHKALKNISNSIRNPIKRLVYKIEAANLKRWEEHFYKKCSFYLYTFVSIEDKMFFEEKYKIKNTHLIPVGAEIYPYNTNNKKSHNVAYFGKMDYPANAEAALWFLENVFPKVLQKVPDAKFYIVGKNPTALLLEMQCSNIIVTGTVDSLDPFYELAQLVVIPLSHGGGVKVKLLEGLGRGKLVLSTKKGIEGTVFSPNEDLIIVDNLEDMATVAIDALLNPERYEQIRRNGYMKVKNSFSWETILNDFESFLNHEL